MGHEGFKGSADDQWVSGYVRRSLMGFHQVWLEQNALTFDLIRHYAQLSKPGSDRSGNVRTVI